MNCLFNYSFYRKKPDVNVKSEPVSSTNERESLEPSRYLKMPKKQERSEDFEQPNMSEPSTSTNANVTLPMQADAFENDPEAGPSGLQTRPCRRTNKTMHRTLRYQSDSSSDDDSDDVRVAQETASKRWLNNYHDLYRKENESGDTHYFNQTCRFDDTTAPNEPVNRTEASVPIGNQEDEIIELSENESVQSNVIVETTPVNANQGLEAPDLQLDWASDTSSDNEIVCTIRSRSPPARNVALNLTRSNLHASESDTDLPPIDLTVSDDEEAGVLLDPMMVNLIDGYPNTYDHQLQGFCQKSNYTRLLRSSNYPDDDRTER